MHAYCNSSAESMT
uniref:Uncharacterized protein n=1 Tax=Arundo donax TaxID=35708 RepID=A0A0A9BKT4_ARUDO